MLAGLVLVAVVLAGAARGQEFGPPAPGEGFNPYGDPQTILAEKHRPAVLEKLPPDVPKETAELVAEVVARRLAYWELRSRQKVKPRIVRGLPLSTEDLRLGRLAYPPKVGDVGTFWNETAKITQVVNEGKMLVESWPSGRDREPAWCFLLAPTAGLVDGLNIPMRDPLRVKGTETYETAGGAASTVFVLEPLKFEEGEVVRLARVTLGKLAFKEESREWRDKSGQFRVVAVLISLSTKDAAGTAAGNEVGRVVLQKEDGSTVEVDVEKLSAADQKFLREMAGTEKPLPGQGQ